MDEADDPFKEFKNPSPYYKFKTGKGGSRRLMVTNNRDANTLRNFQVYANRAKDVAAAHGFRVKEHTVRHSSGVRFCDLLDIFPGRL